ncbi:metal-binding protein [Hydrococcus rivularis NIES-593]|uniref:Metal-binding protein n=1 Tax=Hydrococcus rivularis NIES-593 TaxID=1921803 RepID=A0A1U7HAL4_9CYAN|nr:YceD family protein [Hydrococcus rivularis]OKH20620.1 metal-binding protein [Hydrococcus rivularis NIES-593]
MEAIYIPQLLKALERKETLQIQEFIPGLETLTPVRGSMTVNHRGNFLEVFAKAETIVTLTCDRCLKQYNHRLSLDTSEIIWLDKNADQDKAIPLEREISMEDLSETLPFDGYFEPDTWLYEQLSLLLPLRRLCTQDCQPAAPTYSQNEPGIDTRWASLEALRKQLSE